MTDERMPNDHRPPMPAGRVLQAGLIALGLAAVLNASALERTARGLPTGLERRIALAVVQPFAEASRTLWLDRPRALLDRALGRTGNVAAPAPTDIGDSVPPVNVRIRMGEDGAQVITPGSEGSFRRPTADDPADVWIIGDSLVELLGPHLSNRLNETEVVTPEVDFRFVSGLTRPDFFDWPTYISNRVRQNPPEIIVAMYGGNDGQSVTVDGTVYEAWTRPWWRLYRSRVAEAMDAMRGEALRAYWIGLPIMKSETFSAHARQMNEVYQSEAEERAWMEFVPTWDVFTDRRGRYADYLPNANGELRLMRYEDGVHFTPPGAVRLARHVFGSIAEDFNLPRED